MSSQANIPISSAPKTSFKTRFQVLGWLFGKPLEAFNHLLPMSMMTSAMSMNSGSDSLDPLVSDSRDSSASITELTMPTDQNIIQHYMFSYDLNRVFPSTWQVSKFDHIGCCFWELHVLTLGKCRICSRRRWSKNHLKPTNLCCAWKLGICHLKVVSSSLSIELYRNNLRDHKDILQRIHVLFLGYDNYESSNLSSK